MASKDMIKKLMNNIHKNLITKILYLLHLKVLDWLVFKEIAIS